MEKVLLHACCAICSGEPIRHLRELGYEPIVYFCNNNFDTLDEYNKRLDAEIKLCTFLNAELIIEEYTPNTYHEYIKGLENEPEGGKRCLKCFELRLKESAKKAKTLGIKSFTTSMIISPHKNFKNLSKVGENIGKEFGLDFLAIDFKKKDGFLKTNKLSKELGLYRQNYCGCIYAKKKEVK
ncbi:MAG: epoxyqueuosine reductase QueH [Candidatus Gastranaerophilales bacterium]|nr:epoxyqueuosine reductase QueH [Candidatus Gastranaerophilales bacterium]